MPAVWHNRLQTLIVLSVLLCAGMVFAVPAAQAQTAAFGSIGKRMVVTPFVRWHMDESGTLDAPAAAAILQGVPAYGGDSEWLELGYFEGVLWLGIPITNETSEEHLVLEFRNPRMSYVDLYVPNAAGGYDVLLNGAARPFGIRPFDHPMPAFPITLGRGENVTVLMRLENVGDFRQRIWLYDITAFANRISRAYHSDMVSIGVWLVLAIYHFLVFLSLREKGYLYLSLFVLAWMLFYMSGNGTGKMLLWNDFTWLSLRANSVFNALMNAAFLLFSMTFLESSRFTPRLYRIGVGIVLLWLALFVYTSVSDNLFRIFAGRYMTLGTIIFISLLSIQAIRAGSPMGKFFLFSWIYLFAAGLILLALTSYIVSARWIFGTPIVSILFTISILLWSFELTGRIKVRAREQREILERQVKERTRALETALRDVKTLSGLLPICSSCKKIRDDTGYWSTVESYVSQHTDAGFTHGICPECIDELYPQFAKRIGNGGEDGFTT